MLVQDAEKLDGKPAKISVDHMYLHERAGQYNDNACNPPQMVMVDHKSGRLWVYRVPNKGIMEGAAWLPRRMVQDIDNCGYADVQIQLKSDQEPAIVNVQTTIQEARPKIVPTNSPVGESESNGRVENAIRRIQEKIRVLRHQFECSIKEKIQDDAPIMAWMIRWAGELISKYAVGDDGKTAYERIRGEPCMVPVMPFGETVVYFPLRIAKHNKGEASRQQGVWLGTIERTEETLIGTTQGVVKCRIVHRLPEGERWNPRLVTEMQGVPWELVFGRQGQHIPVEISKHGHIMDELEENLPPNKEDVNDDEQDPEYNVRTHSLHVSRRAINKYGTVEGCPACRIIERRGHMTGRVGYNHSNACRDRIKKEMQTDPEYRRLMHKHEPHHEAGHIEILTEAQINERKHNIQRAVNIIERRMYNDVGGLEKRLTHTMVKHLLAKMEVAEVYSPPRVPEMARKMGLHAGWAFDITVADQDGRAWDFNQLEMRNRAIRNLLSDKPTVLIGSPMCTAFCQLNHINFSKMHPEEVRQRIQYGRKHFEFCAKLYQIQHDAGPYFLHGHPVGAGSWQEECIKKILNKDGVVRVVGDQCRYRLVANDGDGVRPAKKSTGFMTNSPCVAAQVNKRCPNNQQDQVHQHEVLINGRAKAAQVYPSGLCKAICNGVRQQFITDRKGQLLLAQLGGNKNIDSAELLNVAREIQSKCKTVEEEDSELLEEAWDDVSGARLKSEKVKKARQEEAEYIHKMNLYTKVPTAECHRRTGKAPIIVRWFDINKGDEDKHNYRSRLVAREINTHKREDLFAATPPLEALKLILSIAASSNKGEIGMINDVSRAFFHAKATRDAYVKLLAEDLQPGEEELFGKLNFSMYGTRDAAQNWQSEYSQRLIDSGFTRGKASPCVFHHVTRGIRALVHGDDYVSVGLPGQLKWMEEQFASKYQIKTQLLGPHDNNVRELNILNRIIAWNPAKGIVYEADPRHVEIVVEQLGLKEAKPVSTPGTKEEGTITKIASNYWKAVRLQSTEHWLPDVITLAQTDPTSRSV